MLSLIATIAPPFSFNNLLGPLMALGLFLGALKVLAVMGVLRRHLQKEEDSFRKSHLPRQDS
ncbi:hypothetical protein [Ruficoccus sp. ZRK36]|uniref:hypothetical protein n=1 Tax=Ruficoccus sp. ZRK36 TaxID=2866311 RepID=UPI001C733C55|nr:hypothetical protein [Ruficoccus sp. ZRK36]QYY36510.1 hypothetical protein K0V07_03335 [Ruficoccus sp. ZRK36]